MGRLFYVKIITINQGGINMGFFKSKKGAIISEYFQSLEKIGDIGKGNMLEVSLYDDHLTIGSKFIKQTIKLNYNQINDVEYVSDVEKVKQSKKPIGRAVAGGLLLGGIGAVVGAVSGVGSKEKKKYRFYFIISYTSSDGKDKFLQFEDTRSYKGFKLSKKLKELCVLKEENSTEINL